MSKRLTQDDIIQAANRLSVDAATIHAFIEVESSGKGFLPDGRVIVQYEPHVMYGRLRDRFDRQRADEALAQYPDLVARRPGSYKRPSEEDRDMDRASQLIDRECALESASWGLFQIMGYHWERLGYPTLQDFVNAMFDSEGGQLDAFVRFVLADTRLHRAIQRHDWAGAAAIYNGPSYAKFRYDVKLGAAHARHSKR